MFFVIRSISLYYLFMQFIFLFNSDFHSLIARRVTTGLLEMIDNAYSTPKPSQEAQSYGALEYTERGVRPHHKCSRYVIKLSDSKGSVLELWVYGIPLHFHFYQVHSDSEM